MSIKRDLIVAYLL